MIPIKGMSTNFWVERLELTGHRGVWRRDVGNIAPVPHILVSSWKLFREGAAEGEAGRRKYIGTEHMAKQYSKPSGISTFALFSRIPRTVRWTVKGTG